MQNNIKLTIKAKLVNILAALAYVLFYDFIYKSFIVSRFDTLYSTYGYIQNVNQVFYYILGVVPILFFTGVKSVSSALSIFSYTYHLWKRWLSVVMERVLIYIGSYSLSV